MATVIRTDPGCSFHLVAGDGIAPLPRSGEFNSRATISALSALPHADACGISSLIAQEIHGERQPSPALGGLDHLLQRVGFGWEDTSEPGHMRLLPPAAFVMSSVQRYAEDSMRRIASGLDLPFDSISGISVFDRGAEALQGYLDLTEATPNLYGTTPYALDDPERSLALRQTSCLQKFAVARAWSLEDHHLPRCLYEISDSFRKEPADELELCFRLRRFHLPEAHIHARSLDEIQDLAIGLHEQLSTELLQRTDAHVLLLTASAWFFEHNSGYLRQLTALSGRPALLKVLDEGEPCGDGIELDVEYKFVDVHGNARELSTFQLDELMTRVFGIVRAEGPVTTIHAVPVGSAERFIYAAFDRVLSRLRRGDFAHLPLWMSPTVVRLVWDPSLPPSTSCLADVSTAFEKAGIRSDVDDRSLSVLDKLQEARQDLVPFQVILATSSTIEDLTVVLPETPASRPFEPSLQATSTLSGEQLIRDICGREDFAVASTPGASPKLSSQPWRVRP